MDAANVSVRRHDKGARGAKSKSEGIADILTALKEQPA
jgi:hypothetical protein